MSIGKLAPRGTADPTLLQRVIESINSLIDGKAAVTGTFTLAAGATTTTVKDNKYESGMALVWSPTTAHAATAMTSLYLSTRNSGSFVLTHNSTADVDRTFLYVRVG